MTTSGIIQFAHTIPAGSQVVLDCNHEGLLVLLAYVLACVAAGTALSMADSVTRAGTRLARHLWSLAGGISMGFGIWAMHFTAMEALRTPLPLRFATLPTALSLIAPIALSYLALNFYGARQSDYRTVLSSLLIGAGIVVMHYLGMSAIILPGDIYYQRSWFLVSLAIAFLVPYAALRAARYLSRTQVSRPAIARAGCAMIMGGAICGVHFSSMAGTIIIAGPWPSSPGHALNASTQLSILVALIGFAIMTIGIISVEVQKRIAQREAHLEEVTLLVNRLESAQAALQDVAWRDPVTDLGNRHSFNRALDQLIARSQSTLDGFTLLFVDVDDFKQVNDSLGHACGDKLLRSIARRLCGCLRPTDQVARFGGDEFVILLHEERQFQPEVVAERIVEAMQRPFVIERRSLSVGISIGAARYPENGTTSTELLRNADTALYHAKSLGKGRYAPFNEDMHRIVHRRLLLENALRAAIDKGDIDVHYQPIADVRSGRIAGLEALARWSLRGLHIPPAEFIPLAEQNGSIIPLGRLVLHKALAGFRTLLDAGHSSLTLSVNLSALQFQDKSLADTFATLLSRHGINGQQVRIEITESALMEDSDTTFEQLERIKALGIGVSIDDFGTGYSSLSNLNRLPIDELKIDKSFVDALPANTDDAAISEAIMAMARTLRIRVVVEGIETREQARFFYRSQQCEYLQGYLISRPLDLAGTTALLAAQQEGAFIEFWRVEPTPLPS